MQSTQRVVSVNNLDEGDAAASDPLFVALRAAILQDLRPNIQRIDVNGEYPETFMRRVGALGGFKQGTPTELGGAGQGIKRTIQVIEEVAQDCLSTGFITWCQTVCAWYIQNGESAYLKEQVLPKVISGEILAGTGLSNPMKHFAGIEKIHIHAQRRPDGYVLNGAIPWVSNVNSDHYFAVVAKIVDEDNYLMAAIPANLPGFTLSDGGHFIALEGSSTYSCAFRNVFVPNQYILASPCHDYVAKIRPGFILAQTGFGFGLVSSCIELMRRTNETKGHVNRFLDDQAEDIEADLLAAQKFTYTLADEIGCGQHKLRSDITRDAVQARIMASQLALRASQAAMLHAGASGYRQHTACERKLRESYFVAIVTPALKHLKKLLHDMQNTPKVAKEG
ncbi:MAG: acyl-CoA dehydrogenase family protein [Ktedonobacteraceae bacterium]